jgi:hypothetical protein
VIYQKAPNQGPCLDEPRRSWGKFTRYTEIGDDLYAHRHVDVYANGYSLRYDRTHWVDGFGILADMRYNAKKWENCWGPVIAIDPSEFDAVWQAAEASPTWTKQLSSAKMVELGTVPVWLTRRTGRA